MALKVKTYNNVQANVTFSKASSRVEINPTAGAAATENIALTLGKISKWYDSLVPTGGSSGKFLGWNSSGTAKWVDAPTAEDKNMSQTLKTDNVNRPLLMSIESTSNTTSTVTTTGARNNSMYGNVSTGLIFCRGREISNVTLKTGSTAQSHITLNTLMTWLITSKNYIPSGKYCHVVLTTAWDYSNSDILQVSINGTNYEIQLAGVIIEFMGSATSYNAGTFRLLIHSSPTTSFTAATGYTKFPTATIAEYTCNGSSYSPVWKMILNAHPTITVSADTTSNTPLSHGGTFTAITSVTRDSNGHTTKVNTATYTLPSDNNTTYTFATGDAVGQFKVKASTASSYTNYNVNGISAGTDSGTANLMAYYSTATKISSTPKMAYHEINSTASTPVQRNILHLFGAGVGNDAPNLISGTVGIISYGDGGPQINFNTAGTDTITGGQNGAIIFTDHDSAATGVSWHFVSDQTDWNVISKRFHAKTSISIGTDKPPSTTYAFYVAGSSYHTGDIVIGTSGSSSNDTGDIAWKYGNGNEKARIWFDDTYTAKQGPRFRLYKSDGTSLYSGYLPLADGTSASGTWGISITGTAASANKLNTNAGDTNRPVYFSGGIPVRCDTPVSGKWWNGVPYVGNNGVLEIGKYIDFHATDTSTADYTYRFETTSNGLTATATGSYNTLTMVSPDYSQIRFQTTASGKGYTAKGITVYPLTTSGQTMLIQSDGNVVIGGGESSSTLYSNSYDNMDTAENETLYLASDSNEIHLITNVQAYSGRKVLKISDGQLVKSGGQWIAARDTAPVYTNKPNTQDGGYYPAWFAKTKSGGWSMGVLSHSDNLYITYTTDEDYSGGTNNNTYLIQFQNKTGTVALTSDIPTVPTVNNASLTLKGAGTTVTTFTANASTNQSLDIVAGTNVTITPDATNHKITIASSYTNTKYGISGAYGSNNNTWVTTLTEGGTGTTSTVPTASTSVYGITKLYNGVDSTSTGLAATANAVKTAYDKANHSHPYLPLAGGTMTGVINLWANQYDVGATTKTALNCNNSNITGINSLIFGDLSDNAGEGIMFYRSATPSWDVLWAKNGLLYFSPNYPTDSDNLSIGFFGTSSNTDAWSSIGVGLYTTERFQLKIIRTGANNAYPSWMGWAYSAAIAFGGADTKGVVSVRYDAPGVMFIGGQNDSSHTKPNWNFGISGTSGTTYNLSNLSSTGLGFKLLSTRSEIDATAGSFIFGTGALAAGSGADWVGFQADAGYDKFQLIPYGASLLYREDDDPASQTSTWGDFKALQSLENVTGSGGITVTHTSVTIGTGSDKITFNSGAEVKHSNNITAGTAKGDNSKTLTFGGTFTIPSITYDANGHITTWTTTTMTMPSNPNSDTKVTQSSSTTADYRPITLGAKNTTTVSQLDATVTDQVYTSQNFFVKPSTGVMFATEFMTKSYLTGTGSDLGQYGLYLKSYLKRADNTEALYSDYVVRTYNGKISSNDGMLVTVGGGGLTILGGGESAGALAGLISDDTTASGATTLNVGGTLNTTFYGNSERAIISSDDAIYFITNCQTIANRKPVCLDNNLYFYPGTNDTGSIGTSSYRWNSVYANVVYGVDHKTIGTSHGYYLKDQSGTEYGGVYDNGSNLWIGSIMSNARHHKGQTYISTGWTGNLPTTSGEIKTGNSSILISVPKYTATSATAGTWDHTPYFILHSGNFTTTGSGNAITSVAFTNEKLTFTKGSTFSLSTHTHDSLYAVNSSSAVPSTTLSAGQFKVFYNVNQGLANNMPASNNANFIIQLNKHSGNYDSQLGFSSNGNIYYRNFNAETIGSQSWRTILDSGNLEAEAKHLDSYSAPVYTSIPINPIAYPLAGFHRSNKLAFVPAANITIEYSTDGGSTWVDYGASNDVKRDLFINKRGSSVNIGPSSGDRTTSMMTRVIVESDGRDAVLDRFLIQLDSGYHNVAVDVYVASASTPTTYTKAATGNATGTWAYEYEINLKHNASVYYRFSNSYYKKIAFYFRYTSVTAANKSASAAFSGIMGFTGSYWGGDCKSHLANLDHLYTWDRDQNVTFPAGIFGKIGTKLENGVYGTEYGILFTNVTTASANTAADIYRNGNFKVKFRPGTTSVEGWTEIFLGNTTASTANGNSTGWIGFYNKSGNICEVAAADGANSVYQYFPNVSGTLLNNATGLPLAGGSMTGTINTPVNEVAIDFRNYDNWHTCVSYQTGGDEAFVFAAQNARTSIMFVSSENSIANHTNTRWQSLTPALQIKNNCVSIGKLIPQGTTPTIPLEVASKIAISTATSGSPELQFIRGTTADNYYDWRLRDSGGDFYFDVCTGSNTWTSRAWFPYGSNNFTILGSMSLKNGSYTATVQPSTMTANRTLVLPDKSGGLPVSNILYENSTGTQAPVVAEAKGYKYFIVTVYHGTLGEQTAMITPNQTSTDHCYFSWTHIDDSQAASLRVAGAHIKVEPASSTNSITFTVYVSDRHIVAPGNSSTISSTATSGTPVIRKIIGFM